MKNKTGIISALILCFVMAASVFALPGTSSPVKRTAAATTSKNIKPKRKWRKRRHRRVRKVKKTTTTTTTTKKPSK